jgi:crotonobetainyl-CoA:carnitine CoA-transferase CaiB-like acyl-CoA transferase
MADVSAGVHAFAAIGYALFNRERSGQGQYMDISMIDCLIHMHEVNLQVPQLTDGKFVPKRMGAHHQLLCPCGVFKGPQGYIAILCTQVQWPNLCRALGQPGLEHDPRFAESAIRAGNQDQLIALIEAWMAGFDDDAAVLARLDAERVPSAPVLSPTDALTHPYFAGRGTIRAAEDPILGRLMLPGFPLRFSGQREYPARTAPLLGEHNGAILSGLLGLGDAEIEDMAARGLLGAGDR